LKNLKWMSYHYLLEMWEEVAVFLQVDDGVYQSSQSCQPVAGVFPLLLNHLQTGLVHLMVPPHLVHHL